MSLGLIAVLAAAGCRPEAGAPATAAPAPDPQKLAGRWLRYDSDYTITIDNVSPGGKLEARYRNPKPIHVSRAEWKMEDGRLGLLVEMTDALYPGSFYTLTYDPGSDTLNGVYHQKLHNQEFDVAFSRVAEAGEPAPGPAGSDVPRSTPPRP